MAGRVERIRGAVARDSGRPTTMSGLPSRRYRDDLEAQIDEFLDGLWNLFRDHIRGLIILFLLGAMFYLFVWPSRGTWGGYITLMLFFMIQIAFAITFMIVQFGALFWFLGRGRTYWVKPGETGVTFQDYKGNPEVLESARRIVTLLRGVQEFKEMGGEAIRGLLLVGPPGTGKSYLAQAISSEAGVPFV
jgi:cell division protease FtsH